MSGKRGTRLYELLAFSEESTVVAEFTPKYAKESEYQSEYELEREFIRQLRELSYEYTGINNITDLEANLQKQVSALNGIEFSSAEWERFFETVIARKNEGIVEKTRRIQQEHVQILKRDDGSEKNIYLVDKANIHNNRLQVINQYEAKAARRNRYDVTILVNGLPLVHVELKRRGVSIREAFNQINRYKRDSFWADSGLFEYIQLFVISNGTNTKYYSNTTRQGHIEESRVNRAGRQGQNSTSNSFAFTSYWTDSNNERINDLRGFTQTFFFRHTLLRILFNYCVFNVQNKLLVLRPYQIAAIEKIIERITISTTYKQLGKIEAGGYIWHTTGSGKTLTSFKLAQLLGRAQEIKKVLFVVDRRDLDDQTVREYNNYEPGAANSNASTKILKKQLEDSTSSLIITTIQKLSYYVKQHSRSRHEVYKEHVVLIFDECHRSQFGQMHRDITKFFTNYNLFGFTGTPIFTDNAQSSGVGQKTTTEQVFGDKLHSYTIVNAIDDKNVLPFRMDYTRNIRISQSDVQVDVGAGAVTPLSEPEADAVYCAPKRIRAVVSYILAHFAQKTKRSAGAYTSEYKQKNLLQFNSLFATSSIHAAMLYYAEFKEQQKTVPEAERLRIAIIYSYAQNEDGDEEVETSGLPATARDFLEAAIQDYNAMFSTNFDTSGEKFQGYYKNLATRLRDGQVDMAIVVNMFLTGFDSTRLNTLWVDKNVQNHGLIQAYSRTNRILNSVKSYGTIVCFRDLEAATNEALALFGNKNAQSTVILEPYEEYYRRYEERVKDLLAEFPLSEDIQGEARKIHFVKLYGEILALRNVLSSFDEFAGSDCLSERDVQDYQSRYLDIYQEIKRLRESDSPDADAVDPIFDELEFEIELLKQVDVNVDYILMLVEQYVAEHAQSQADERARREVLIEGERAQGLEKHEAIRDKIRSAMSGSPSLRNKRDLIEKFIGLIDAGLLKIDKADVREAWEKFIHGERRAELQQIISREELKLVETERFMKEAFRNGAVPTTGTAINGILPPTSRFARRAVGENALSVKKRRVLARLIGFFERFFGV